MTRTASPPTHCHLAKDFNDRAASVFNFAIVHKVGDCGRIAGGYLLYRYLQLALVVRRQRLG
jgi:hypothetical protein